MALTITHATAADASFSSAGATNWNANHTVAGSAMAIGDDVTSGTATRVLFLDANAKLAHSASLTYSDTLLFSAAGLQIGTTGTNAGWKLGYSNTSGRAGIWNNSQTPNIQNAVLFSDGSETTVQSPAGNFTIAATSAIFMDPGGLGGTKVTAWGTAGRGLDIAAGTATTDVAALSITQTWNNAACATGFKYTITDTTSAAGALAFQILGGAAGTTNLISVSKAGLVDAPAYAAGGSAGVDFGPGVVTSITIKKGIVTAAS